mmetsp:Transcript_8912/g.25685  ORF Transcript_8912/g.25685 Transcript_8912/m.25685 type:complete len:265 (-) Transcript_8912:270-1064(-)
MGTRCTQRISSFRLAFRHDGPADRAREGRRLARPQRVRVGQREPGPEAAAVERVGARQDDRVVVEARLLAAVVAVAELVEANRAHLLTELGPRHVPRERRDHRCRSGNVAVPDGSFLYRHSDRLEPHGPFVPQPTAHCGPHRQYDHDDEAAAHAAAAALAPAVVLGMLCVVVPGLGRVAAVERTAVHALTRRRAAVAAVVGAGGVVELGVAGSVAGRRTLVRVEERVVARRLGTAITLAAGAVAAVRRLEVRTGAPRAAVPMVT